MCEGKGRKVSGHFGYRESSLGCERKIVVFVLVLLVPFDIVTAFG